MHINLYLIPFVIVLGLLLGINDNQKSRRLYIVICSVVLLLVAALRNSEFMTFTYNIDSLVYQNYFEDSYEMTWKEYWQAATSRYVDFDDEADLGFIGLNIIIGLFTHNYQIFSIIAGLLFFVPFGLVLDRYCISMRQVIFAYIYYIALIQIYLIGGGRQMYAIGMDMMALLSVIDRKPFTAALFFFIGVSFHFSSLLFIFPLLLIWFRIKPRALKVSHFICFIVFPIVYLIPNQLISFMGNAVGMDKYAEYGNHAIHGGTNTFIFLVEVLSLFCLIAIKRRDLQLNKSILPLYTMVPFFTFFAPLVRANGTMIRIALYFSIFLTVLTPYSIDCMFKQRRNNVYYVLAIGALSLLTLSGGGIIYRFYWQ